MDGANILENAFGNAISDFFIGGFVVIVVTRYFEKLSHKRDSIGFLRLIEGEIQVNKHILKGVLNDMIPGFEKEKHRGEMNEITPDQDEFKDAAHFMRVPIDNLLFEAFRSNYSGLGNLDNGSLVEKVINLYTVSYHSVIKIAFQMEQLNWYLLDTIKVRLQKEIQNSENLSIEIKQEIDKLRKRRIFLEALKFWEIFR